MLAIVEDDPGVPGAANPRALWVWRRGATCATAAAPMMAQSCALWVHHVRARRATSDPTATKLSNI